MNRNNESNRGCVFITIILYILMMIGFMYGYVNNIVQFVKCDFKPPYKAEVIRTVGIFTGLGFIFGHIELGK